MTAYKLLRARRDGTLGPLFINRKQRIPIGEQLIAEDHKTKGYAHRPGWHCCKTPEAPHLSPRGRQWYVVDIEDIRVETRPKSQGGIWYLAQRMTVLEKYENR